MRHGSAITLWALVSLLIATATSIFAPAPASAAAVSRVDVTGNHWISKQVILSVFGLRAGDELRAERVTEGVKRLFQTKNFADVSAEFRQEGDSLVVVVAVEEYPKVKEVRLQGFSRVKREDIEGKVALKEGFFARPAAFTQDVLAIKALYAEKGYNRAAVEVKQFPIPAERAVIISYAITEGKKVKIRHIDFLGIGAVTSKDLTKILETKESRWWRGGELKAATLEADLQKIKELYGTLGYLDAEAKIERQEEQQEGKYVDLYIKVDEGKRYFLGDLTWSGNTVVSDDEIRKVINIKKGDPFATDRIEAVQFYINGRYWEEGYMWSRIMPERRLRGRNIDLALRIVENNQASINEIKIAGNTKTFENVIRRELDVHPGDKFVLSEVQRGVRDIMALGYFNGYPKIDTEPVSEGGNINLVITVEEKQTGNFRFGAGFSQLNSLSGFFGIAENNFLGRGKGVSLDWEFGRYRTSFNFQYTEPYFRNTNNTISLSVYNWIQDRVAQQYYNDRRKGFSVSLARPVPVLDYARLFTSYRLEEVELSDFSTLYPANAPLRMEEWPQVKSSVLVSLTRSSTDNPTHPTAGSINTLSAEFCGGILGGNVNYMRYMVETSWFRTFFWKFTFHLNMEAAIIDGYSDPSQVQDFEKFRLGGNRRYALRGYDFYEVVPEGNPEYIGGRFMTTLTQEILFPFTQAIYGLVFFDAGNTWNSFSDADLFNLRRGLGLGVRIEMPAVGNLGFDYGYGFDKRGEPAWEPHFTFGTFF